jgi:hypothetical protein
MRWREYIPVAWQVDPALALSLQDHFPANSDVKHALEALVVEHAHAAKVGTAGFLTFVISVAFNHWTMLGLFSRVWWLRHAELLLALQCHTTCPKTVHGRGDCLYSDGWCPDW